MASALRLTVLTGPHKDRKFCFCGPARCQIGRGMDCFVNLSGTDRDVFISRHHCHLNVDPPDVRVLDLGSRNGTYVNGKKVEPNPNEPFCVRAGSVVKPGDVLTIGGTTLKLDIVDCPYVGNELADIWRPGETATSDCFLPCPC